MDAVEQANSGHPGMPMGMADIAEVLWTITSATTPPTPTGPTATASFCQMATARCCSMPCCISPATRSPIDDLRNFRQLGSHTAGHPERDLHLGIETTTGPLGQGLANAVGMALAEKLLAAEFNRPGTTIVDHHTYVFLGDGCLMEGVSHEACSLAGTLGLGKLICFYDDNGISIDGHVQGWFTDDTPERFEAYGWQVIRDVDGHDPVAIGAAIEAARAETARPTLICCKTIIGFGAPEQAGHRGDARRGAGRREWPRRAQKLGWPYPPFEIPDDI